MPIPRNKSRKFFPTCHVEKIQNLWNSQPPHYLTLQKTRENCKIKKYRLYRKKSIFAFFSCFAANAKMQRASQALRSFSSKYIAKFLTNNKGIQYVKRMQFTKRTNFSSSIVLESAKNPVYIIIAINVGVFVLANTMPSKFWRDNFFISLNNVASHPHTLVTSAFMHSNWLHLLSNCFVLYSFGPALYHAMGRRLFLQLYASGIAGGAIGFLAEKYYYAKTKPAARYVLVIIVTCLIDACLKINQHAVPAVPSLPCLAFGAWPTLMHNYHYTFSFLCKHATFWWDLSYLKRRVCGTKDIEVLFQHLAISVVQQLVLPCSNSCHDFKVNIRF